MKHKPSEFVTFKEIASPVLNVSWSDVYPNDSTAPKGKIKYSVVSWTATHVVIETDEGNIRVPKGMIEETFSL